MIFTVKKSDIDAIVPIGPDEITRRIMAEYQAHVDAEILRVMAFPIPPLRVERSVDAYFWKLSAMTPVRCPGAFVPFVDLS